MTELNERATRTQTGTSAHIPGVYRNIKSMLTKDNKLCISFGLHPAYVFTHLKMFNKVASLMLAPFLIETVYIEEQEKSKTF